MNEAPEDFKLSSLGTLALRFRDRIELRTRGGSASVPLMKDFADMAFARTGEYFCLWERDRREKGQNTAAYNYWTVWSQSATEFEILGDMIYLPIPPYSPGKVSGIQLFSNATSISKLSLYDPS